MPHHPIRSRQAFTLVELSIALVIAGLLVGGVVAGQSLVRSSKLRNVTSEYTTYAAATASFVQKYGYLPGDLPNASNFWGMRAGSGSTTGADAACYNKLGVTSGTCNGNGDGKLSDNGAVTTCPEFFLYWQHLSDAGLIGGSFTGATTTGGHCWFAAGTNTVASKISSTAIWQTSWINGPVSGDSNLFDGDYNWNTIQLIGQSGTLLFTPQEAYNMDLKVDDGLPGSGDMYALKHSSAVQPNCATTNVVSTAAYDQTQTSMICAPYFKLP